mmetsp:Transcript_77458/g.90259  ORF Transcript_77458/g.90259 Transcript_77458/m.90259 type:complete len:212 (-) Transcript_77458:228-863(-)
MEDSLLDALDFSSTERGAVDLLGTLKLGAVANGRTEKDHLWLATNCTCFSHRRSHAIEIGVSILHNDGVPSQSLHLGLCLLCEGDAGVAINGNFVVVVDHNELLQTQMTSQRDGLLRDALHETAISAENVREVVNNREVGAVEDSSKVGLRDGQANGVADTLAEGTRRHFNSRSDMALRVARSLGVKLTELLEFVERQVVAGEMKHCVEEC